MRWMSVTTCLLPACLCTLGLLGAGCSTPIVGADAGPPDAPTLDVPVSDAPPLDTPMLDAPIAPVDAPVTPIDAPVAPVDAPVTPVDAPVTPIDAPVTPVDAPVTPVDAPPLDAPGVDRIRLDAFTVGPEVTAASSTTSHGTGGTDRLIVAAVFFTTATLPTSVTYAGLPLTYVDEALAGAGGSPPSAVLYYRIGPPTGANDLVVTFAAATRHHVDIASYTGVEQSTTNMRSTQSMCDTACPSPYDTGLTTAVDGSWTVAAIASSRAPLMEGVASMIRGGGDDGAALVDSDRPINPAGPTTLGAVAPMPAAWRTVMMSFAPAP